MDNNKTATVGGQTGHAATDNGNRTGQNSSGSIVNSTNSTSNNTGSISAERTYTAAELEAEVDRRVNQAQLKWAAGLDEKLSAAKTEGEKLAKMTADQRAKAEFEQQRTNFENERAQYQLERLEFEAAKQLGEQNLPISFAKMCVGKDAEQTKANIDTFKTEWSNALQVAVNDRMKGTPPKTGGSTGTNADAAAFVDIISELHR